MTATIKEEEVHYCDPGSMEVGYYYFDLLSDPGFF
jgi:hypothetical protein